MNFLIVLTLTVFINNGAPMQASQPVESLDKCIELQHQFLKQDPADFDAKALGASCVVITKGDPA